MAIHLVSLVLPLEKEFEKQVLAGATHLTSTCFSKDFPSPIGFLANGGGERGGGLNSYIEDDFIISFWSNHLRIGP
jgi:hypothetical protein